MKFSKYTTKNAEWLSFIGDEKEYSWQELIDLGVNDEVIPAKMSVITVCSHHFTSGQIVGENPRPRDVINTALEIAEKIPNGLENKNIKFTVAA